MNFFIVFCNQNPKPPGPFFVLFVCFGGEKYFFFPFLFVPARVGVAVCVGDVIVGIFPYIKKFPYLVSWSFIKCELCLLGYAKLIVWLLVVYAIVLYRQLSWLICNSDSSLLSIHKSV